MRKKTREYKVAEGPNNSSSSVIEFEMNFVAKDVVRQVTSAASLTDATQNGYVSHRVTKRGPRGLGIKRKMRLFFLPALMFASHVAGIQEPIGPPRARCVVCAMCCAVQVLFLSYALQSWTSLASQTPGT